MSANGGVHERLRRLLVLVPYVAQHQGISVSELSQALSLTREALLEDLDLLSMVGRPPFNPDDFIDVYVENERVYVDLDQRFSKPPRLTPGEATALAAAAALLRPAAGEALQRALTKLERVLPTSAKARYREMAGKIDATTEGPPELVPLAHAISERQQVRFDYFSQGRGETEARTVEPLELFSHRGHWYLLAHCLARVDERLFRLDRIQNLQTTGVVFAPRNAASRSLPKPTLKGRGDVRVRFTPTAAAYVQERFGGEAVRLADGGAEVRVTGDAPRWLVQWVLSFGGEAEVVEPEWARQAVAQAAQASLS
ncbi:MAG: helix-turn-helix transcriptional regulator [Myxococcaceae bacterium]